MVSNLKPRRWVKLELSMGSPIFRQIIIIILHIPRYKGKVGGRSWLAPSVKRMQRLNDLELANFSSYSIGERHPIPWHRYRCRLWCRRVNTCRPLEHISRARLIIPIGSAGTDNMILIRLS